MVIQFRLAALGHTMEKGRVVEWHVREGSQVKEGEPLLSVETDKATVDVEAPVDGVLLRIVGKVDEEYAVGAILAWIGEAGEEIPEDTEESAAWASATSPRPWPGFSEKIRFQSEPADRPGPLRHHRRLG